MSQEPAISENDPEPPQWLQPPKRGCIGSFVRLLFALILLTALLLPFTPFASKIKKGIQDIVESARGTKERIITRDVPRDVIKEVPVTREVVKEVTKEVIREVQPPLPDKYIPRKDIDVATLFNGITVKTNLLTEQGSFASLERLDPESYKAEFQLSIRVPKANQTMVELSRINKHLPAILPGSMPCCPPQRSPASTTSSTRTKPTVCRTTSHASTDPRPSQLLRHRDHPRTHASRHAAPHAAHPVRDGCRRRRFRWRPHAHARRVHLPLRLLPALHQLRLGQDHQEPQSAPRKVGGTL
jgi:hypothetical protein